MINNHYWNQYFNINTIDNDADDFSGNFIRHLNNSDNHISNLLNNIIQHPFIDNLPVFTNNIHYKKYSKINIIFYRINYSNKIPFIEYYFENLNSFSFMDNSNYKTFNKLNDDIYNYFEKFSIINGTKIIEGAIEDNELYIIVKIKINNSNYNYKNWLTIYDIVVNKHFFGINISTHIINFFIKYFNMSSLFLDGKPLIKPIILYNFISRKYLKCVENTNSLLFCNDNYNSYVKLRFFKNNDNLRAICLIDDIEYTNDINNILYSDYILVKCIEDANINENEYINEWLFRNEKRNIYIVKK